MIRSSPPGSAPTKGRSLAARSETTALPVSDSRRFPYTGPVQSQPASNLWPQTGRPASETMPPHAANSPATDI